VPLSDFVRAAAENPTVQQKFKVCFYLTNLTLEALSLLTAFCIPENHSLCRFLVSIMFASDKCE